MAHLLAPLGIGQGCGYTCSFLPFSFPGKHVTQTTFQSPTLLPPAALPLTGVSQLAVGPPFYHPLLHHQSLQTPAGSGQTSLLTPSQLLMLEPSAEPQAAFLPMVTGRCALDVLGGFFFFLIKGTISLYANLFNNNNNVIISVASGRVWLDWRAAEFMVFSIIMLASGSRGRLFSP